MSHEERWSREDLIQVEYALYSLKFEHAERKRRQDARVVDADFLGVAPERVVAASQEVAAIDVVPVLLEVARHIGSLPSADELGVAWSDGITWETVAMGADRVRLPKYFRYAVPAGPLSPVPLTVRGWPINTAMQYIEVMARPGDGEHAEAFLADLLNASRGARSPYFGQVVEAYYGQCGLALKVVDLEATDRSTLVLDDSVWDAVTRNVDRMFQKMSVMAAAGLGTNRGLLLAGPPGTGKSALCRALALEYAGSKTVTIVSAAAGQYLLGEVYARLDSLGPGLVLIEDLDLLVGDRKDRERFPLVQFLSVLDGLMTRHSGVVTIATTNDARLVDDAAVRAARFDQVVELRLPDLDQRVAILATYLRHVEHDADLVSCARRCEGFSGADLREVVRAAVLDADHDVINQRDLDRSIERRLGLLREERPTGLYA
jgi:hypothetical protein